MRAPLIILEITIAVVVATALVGCAAIQASAQGGDGLTQQSAVRIIGARTLDEGKAAEARWLAKILPGASIDPSKRRFVLNTAVYEVLGVVLTDGTERNVWFDITLVGGRGA